MSLPPKKPPIDNLSSSPPDWAADDPIPSYEESIADSSSSHQPPLPPTDTKSTSFSSSYSRTYMPTLHQQLHVARATRINTFIAHTIRPLIHTQVLTGVTQKAFILLPTDVCLPPADATEPEGRLVGFRQDRQVEVVRLQEEDGEGGFWAQRGVLEGLRRELGEEFPVRGKTRIEEDVVLDQGRFVESTRKGGFPFRKGSVGRMLVEEEQQRENKRSDVTEKEEAGDEIRVSVELEEVCFRFATHMGLYDSKSGKALVVRVDVGL